MTTDCGNVITIDMNYYFTVFMFILCQQFLFFILFIINNQSPD